VQRRRPEANGFNSLFIGDTAAISSADSFALEVGGGLDWRFAKHVGLRALQASWIRTQLPNSTTNVQNHLTLGSGIVLRF
jgi:hypothetical protein